VNVTKNDKYKEMKNLAAHGKAVKLNVHSKFKQEEADLICPHCGEKITLQLKINERSSAVFLVPNK
jgi:hypothetical protein